MKHGRISVATLVGFALVVTAVVGLGFPASPATAAPSPFVGAWRAIDIPDGSYMTLAVGGNSKAGFSVRLYDFGASACGFDENNKPLYAALARGKGTVDENVLSVLLRVRCLSHPPTFLSDSPFTFTYDPADDTLTDNHGVQWFRMGP